MANANRDDKIARLAKAGGREAQRLPNEREWLWSPILGKDARPHALGRAHRACINDLLACIKIKLPQLEELLPQIEDRSGEEDGVYRFYHHANSRVE